MFTDIRVFTEDDFQGLEGAEGWKRSGIDIDAPPLIVDLDDVTLIVCDQNGLNFISSEENGDDESGVDYSILMATKNQTVARTLLKGLLAQFTNRAELKAWFENAR